MQLTQTQKDLVQGLKLFGCSFIQILLTAAQLWHPDDVIEMLLYMVEHKDATPEELYKASSKISARRGDPPEFDFDEEYDFDEEDEEDEF